MLLSVRMGGHKDRPQVSRLEIVEMGRRRRWSDAEKLRIVEASMAGRRMVSATARPGSGLIAAFELRARHPSEQEVGGGVGGCMHDAV